MIKTENDMVLIELVKFTSLKKKYIYIWVSTFIIYT